MREVFFQSRCQHHMPAHQWSCAYWLPASQGGGISKLVRLVQVCAGRLQTQEKIGAKCRHALWRPRPARRGVVIAGRHPCITKSGVKQQGAMMLTSRMLRVFRDRPKRARNSSPQTSSIGRAGRHAVGSEPPPAELSGGWSYGEGNDMITP
jgi:GTP cyclohydrolase I